MPESSSKTNSLKVAAEAAAFRDHFFTEISHVFRGNESVLDCILVSILSNGHALLIGAPGLGKTLLVKSTANLLGLEFSRVQFTPDLMPADITGSEILDPRKGEFRFIPGPVFANIVLADEINRTPPRTQAALLQAMEEKQVSIGNHHHDLPLPFFVLATQNPLEQEGTYPLPEAQLDRFFTAMHLDYPVYEEEVRIATLASHEKSALLKPLIKPAKINAFQKVAREFPIGEELVRLCVELVRLSREDSAVRYGAGPRASQALVQAARTYAMLSGDGAVETSHIRAMAVPVMQHRLVLDYEAVADGVKPAELIERWSDEIF